MDKKLRRFPICSRDHGSAHTLFPFTEKCMGVPKLMSYPSSVHSRKISLRVTVSLHMYPPFSLIRPAYGPACRTSDCPASPSCSWTSPFGRSWLECPRRSLAPPCSSLPGRSPTYFRSVTVRGCCPATRPSPRIPGSATGTTPASCRLGVLGRRPAEEWP